MGSPHPRVLLASAVDRLGEVAVVEWCCRLMTDTERVDDPDVVLLGGSEEWLPYWRRTWGVRGLLYVFSDGQQVVDGLAAERALVALGEAAPD